MAFRFQHRLAATAVLAALALPVLAQPAPSDAPAAGAPAQQARKPGDLQERHRLAYLFISHDLKVVRALADEVIVLKDGKVVEQGQAAQIFAAPREAYTQTLMTATFRHSIAAGAAAAAP